MIRQNASIVGYRARAGDDPAGGDLLTAVPWPEGRRVPCEVEDYSEERVATLSSLGVSGTRRVVVMIAALLGAGVPAASPCIGDVIDVIDRGDDAPRAWRVLGVRGGRVGFERGAWNGAAVLHVAPA